MQIVQHKKLSIEIGQLRELIDTLESPEWDQSKDVAREQLTALVKRLRSLLLSEPEHIDEFIAPPTQEHSLEIWFDLHFRWTLILCLKSDLWMFDSDSESSTDNTGHLLLLPLLATSVAIRFFSKSPGWQAAWFWRQLFKEFPALLESLIPKRLSAAVCAADCVGDGLAASYLDYFDQQLDEYSQYKNVGDFKLAQISIRSASNSQRYDVQVAQDLLVRAFSDNEVLKYINPKLEFRDYSNIPDRLESLHVLIKDLPVTPPEDTYGLVRLITNKLQKISAVDVVVYEPMHPISRTLFEAARSCSSDDPDSIKRWIEESDGSLSKESLEGIMAAYNLKKFPWVADFVAEYIDANENHSVRNKSPRDCSDESELPSKKETLRLKAPNNPEPDPNWERIKNLSSEQVVFLLYDDRVCVADRVKQFGRLILSTYNELCQKSTTSDQLLSEQKNKIYKDVVTAYTGDRFEREVSKAGDSYASYTYYCQYHLDERERILQLDKCLGKLRHRLRDVESVWKSDSFDWALNELARLGEFERLFKGLILAFKAAPSSGNSDAVRLHWTLKDWAVREQDNKDIALNWYLAKWLPEQMLGVPEDELGNLTELADEERKVASLSRLTELLSDHCTNSLKMIKNKGPKKGEAYTPSQCKEPRTLWRRAYLDALAELHLDRGGNAHRTADFVRKCDFDSETREKARLVHNGLRKLRPHKTARDIHRSYLAALWQLRMAKAIDAGVDIDPALASRWRSRELQRVQ